MTDARVRLWGRDIGAVSWLDDREVAVFQYAPEFVPSGIEVAPLMMPLRENPYQFPNLSILTFKGLPGMLADSLPDRYGNALIDAWLASQGRAPESFNPVERLCYIGSRGMGALEFQPMIHGAPTSARTIEVAALVDLANRVLDHRVRAPGIVLHDEDAKTVEDILRVGTSAAGARAKAIVAWNEVTGEFRSGQVAPEKGFSHWILKFDGVVGNKDKEGADPQGFGRIEFAYHQMAVAAGIEMAPCRLLNEHGRSHFMTRRFDRTETGAKLHMQSLAALMHYDFNRPDAYSYEQAFQAIRRLGLPRPDLEQQCRRAVFNVIARNHDDHVKNIAFLMNRQGEWRLSPAFDVAYAYNPHGTWTSRHQMSVNGKRSDFDLADLIALGATGGIKIKPMRDIIEQTEGAVSHWEDYATSAGVSDLDITRIRQTFRRLR